jgi:hypothetical protein
MLIFLAFNLLISLILIWGILKSLCLTVVAIIKSLFFIASGIEEKVLTLLAKVEKCFDELKPFSLGHGFLGLTKFISLNPKHPIDLIDIPIFSDNCGLFKMN